MSSKELPQFTSIEEVIHHPLEGALDQRWDKELNTILERIHSREGELRVAVRGLYEGLQDVQNTAFSQNKTLKFIFLTRQGVPVYWLLKGFYDGKGQSMPESNVLGISAGYKTDKVRFDQVHETELRSILHIDEKDSLNVFIDDTVSSGKTINASFNLVDILGGDEDRYLRAVLFTRRSEIAPWDNPSIRVEEFSNYRPDSPQFLSTHMYSSPDGDVDCGLAEPPELIANSNSQICTYHIAQALYEIGLKAAA